MHDGVDMRAAARWLAIRVAALPLILIVVSAASHFLLFGPFGEVSDPAERIGGQGLTEAQREQIRDELNLNDPWIETYAHWLAAAARGDLGEDYFSGRSVTQQLRDRLPATAQVLAMSLVVACAISALLAFAASFGRWPERGSLVLIALLASFPVFATAFLAIIYPVLWWDYAPPLGGYVSFPDDPGLNARITITPSVVLGLATAPFFFRAFGAGKPGASSARELPAAIASWFPMALSGVAITELIFSIRGAAGWVFQAALVQDLVVMQALLTIGTSLGMGLWLFTPRRRRAERTRRVERSALTLARDPLVAIGVALIVAVLAVALLGPLISPHEPRVTDIDARRLSPSWDHWFGTDKFGRDTLTRLCFGLRHAFWFSGRVAVLGWLVAALLLTPALFLRRSRLHQLALLLRPLSGVTPLWWLLAVFALFELDENALLWGMALGTAFYTVSYVIDESADLGSARLYDNARQLVPPALDAASWSFAAVALLYLMIDGSVGVGLGGASNGRLGQEVLEDATSFASPHKMWFPILTMALLLFPLNLLAQTLHAAPWHQAEVGEDSAGAIDSC